ncbi:MAG TPA: HDOD domain-containing protein [Verrucomicrobiae bacterium]
MQELDDYIQKVKHLPPAPRVLPKLLTLLGQPNIDSGRIVELIQYDSALTASLLQVCNSAYLASSTPVADLEEAVNRLGFHLVFRLVAGLSGSRTLSPSQKGYGMDEGELWKHSVTSAVAAQLIAAECDVDENVAFTAGLLHDIGKVILSGALEHIYQKLRDEVDTNQQSLLETEKRLLGVQHAEIGGRLLANWKFPAPLVAAVWFHHHPAAAQPHQKLASCVYLGNMIAYFIGNGFGHQAFALRGRGEALSMLGLRGDDLPRLMIETYDHYAGIEALFNINAISA